VSSKGRGRYVLVRAPTPKLVALNATNFRISTLLFEIGEPPQGAFGAKLAKGFTVFQNYGNIYLQKNTALLEISLIPERGI